MKRIEDSNFAGGDDVVGKYNDHALVERVGFTSGPDDPFLWIDGDDRADRDYSWKYDPILLGLDEFNEDLDDAVNTPPDSPAVTQIDEGQNNLITDTSTTSNSSYMDDPEWQKGWQEFCTGDAKPPYPEDCFFPYPY